MVIHKLRTKSRELIQTAELSIRRMSIRSFAAFSQEYPSLNKFSESLDDVRALHHEYVTTVSTPEMAASFELCRFLAMLHHASPIGKSADLGSGFTSYALRKFGQQHNTNVWSVDDNPEWLQKTGLYLSSKGLATSNLNTLEQFIQSGERDFNLILLDLNFVEIRKDYIDFVLDICAAGGLVIFDDVHKPQFRLEVLRKASHHPVSLYDLKPLTEDRFKRFAMIAKKKQG